MADEHCRITVVGGRRRVDLAVPAAAPITDYVEDLARMCAPEDHDVLPSAWSLATGTSAPFAPERSLTELGVADGQVLYLRDIVADEFEEPVVRDVAEQVAEASDQVLERRWDARTRSVTVLACGLGWLVAAVVALGALGITGTAVLGSLALAAGVLLPLCGWVAGERRWPVPASMRLALALCAVPSLGVAGWALLARRLAGPLARGAHPVLTAGGLTTASVVVGVLVGAAIACAAALGVTTCAVALWAVLAAVVGCVLAALRADLVESAAVVAVVAFALQSVSPLVVGRITAFAFRRGTAPVSVAPEGEELRTAVRTALLCLAVWSGLLSLVLAASLVVLGGSASAYAAGTTVCLGVALLLRAGAAKVVVEVVPVGVAGAAGLFTLALTGPGRLGEPAWVAPLLVVVVGALLVGYGFRRLMRRDVRPMSRPAWFGSAGAVLGALSIPLVLAGFGVFGRLMGMGRHL